MKVRPASLRHHEDLSRFERPLSLPRAADDVLQTSDELVIQQAASTRSGKQYICRVSRPYGAWCDCGELTTVKRTSCSICIGMVSQECEYACVNANYFAS